MARTVEIVKAEIERAKANKKRRSHLEAELNVLMSRRIAEAIASKYDPAEYALLPEEEENKHTLLYTFLLAAEVIVIFVLFRYLRWL